MKNGVFWDVTPCDSCRTELSEEFSASFIRVTGIVELGKTLAVTSNRRSVRFHDCDCEECCLLWRYAVWLSLRTDIIFLCSVLRLLVTANVVTSSPILVTLMKDVICSCESFVLTRATLRNIYEDGILHFTVCSSKYISSCPLILVISLLLAWEPAAAIYNFLSR
jgi:hypothetical protein